MSKKIIYCFLQNKIVSNAILIVPTCQISQKITCLLSISISLIILSLSLPCLQVKLIITAKVLLIWKNIIFSRALLIY